MFEFFRRMIVPIMMIALIGFLATIIFSWGADINSRSQYENTNLAAVINGEEITWTQYNRVFENLYKAERDKTDEDITDSKQNELHETAWNQIQYDRLISQEVQKHNITVSDDELYDYLKYSPPQEFISSPTFQTNGQFDYQKYINALADPNYAQVWASYDAYLRSEIKKMKLQELIIQSAHVSESEVQDYFVSLNEKIKFDYINVGYAKYSRNLSKATEEECLAYYNDHLDNYVLDERAVLNAVIIEKKPSQADWDNVEAQIKQLADSIAGGADFAELAKSYSQDGSASNGGDLGWFPAGQMVGPFNDMVFSMKKGEVSPPVKTQFGWHIIKHFGYRTEKDVKQAKASHILLKVVTSQETMDIANNKLNQLKTDAQEVGFEEAAAKNDLTVTKAAPFVRDANIQSLGRDKAASDFAFTSEVNAISPIYENSSVQFVVQLVEKIPEGPASFEYSRQSVERDVLKTQIEKICSDTASVIWSEIQKGTDFTQAAKKHDLEVEKSEEVTRYDYVKGLSSFPEVIGAAFSLENEGDISDPVVYDQGAVLLKLVQKNPLDLTTFTAQKDSLATIILQNKQQEVFGRWFENLISSSEIINNVQNIRNSITN